MLLSTLIGKAASIDVDRGGAFLLALPERRAAAPVHNIEVCR